MIKNETFAPVVANTRNEMIEAVENHEKVIYVCGTAYSEIVSELNKQIKEAKTSKSAAKSAGFLALGAAYVGAFLLPGIGWTIGGLGLASLLAACGIVLAKDTEELLKKYNLAYDEEEGVSKFVLIDKEYSPEYHSLNDGNIITFSDKCPKCGKKYNEKGMKCEHCDAHLIKITNKKALKKVKNIRQ